MKRILIILVLCIGLVNWVEAQQLPQYSQYMNNNFLLNPGVTGSEEYIPIRLTARQQWVGIDRAPSTQALSGNFVLNNEKIGLGAYFFKDAFGPNSKTGAQLSFSYIMPVGLWDSKLALGVSGVIFQYAFDQSKEKWLDVGDPLLNGEIQTAMVPDANFGIYWHNDRFYLGLSANQLMQFQVDLLGYDASKNTLVRHYFMMAGYKIAINDKFDIEPSTQVKFMSAAPPSIDLNVRGIYKKDYWFGISYRAGIPTSTGTTLIAMLGMNYKKYIFGYAYDYPLTNLNRYTSGTHEIVIGVNLNKPTPVGSSLL